MAKKPDVNGLETAEAQFQAFDNQVKEMTLDRMNEAPKQETEQQTLLSQADIAKSKDIYLKPSKSIGSREKFNEKFRSDWKYAMEFVHFTAENKEIIGEKIEIWTKPYPGMPAEYWEVPVNKPVWGPRHLAEQIKRASYHRLRMDESKSAGSDGTAQYFGTMIVDNTVQRLDAIPVSSRKSVFMGTGSF